jgi:hypothetical protein
LTIKKGKFQKTNIFAAAKNDIVAGDALKEITLFS